MNISRSIYRSFLSFLILTSIASPLFAFGDVRDTKPKSLSEDQKIIHVLNRLGFGARPGDVERVKSIGLQKYIETQLAPEKISDAAAENKVKALEIFNMSTAEVFAKYPNPGALATMLAGGRTAQANNNQNDEMTEKQRQERQAKLREYYREYNLRPANQLVPQIAANRILRAVYSERQLQEVMVDFWQNHFNVFSGKSAVRWYIPSYERDVLRKNALGNFKDLVVGTAKHPAMLFYLDNFESVTPNITNNQNTRRAQQRRNPRLNQNLPNQNPTMTDQARVQQPAEQRRQRGINENYARELMELHTLGVDGGYSQADIVEVAKAFTGWTIADPRGYRSAAGNEIMDRQNRAIERLQRQAGVPDDIESGEFYFNERWHEKGAKNVLGQKVDEGGMKDGLKVIDILVNHPSTAKFIARKLAVKFVSDKPSEQLVERVAKAFRDSKGDIKSTLGALFADKEFFAPQNYRAKIKTPFELAVSAIRTVGADTNGGPAILAMLNKLGEVPYGYQAPTGYPDTAEDWVNAGALIERLNFSVALASNRIPGTTTDLKKFAAPSKMEILDRVIAEVLDNDLSAATKSTLSKQLEQPLPEVKAPDEVDDLEMPQMRGQGGRGNNRQARLLNPSGDPEVFKIVSLVLGTPEFQRQ